MKITPYLLVLNGFKEVETSWGSYWKRVEIDKPKNDWGQWEFIIDITPGDYCGEFAPVKYEAAGVWTVSVTAPGLYLHMHIKDFCDLMALSEVIARNQHGFEQIHPIEIYVPEVYVANDWERGDWDQERWDEINYKYLDE